MGLDAVSSERAAAQFSGLFVKTQLEIFGLKRHGTSSIRGRQNL